MLWSRRCKAALPSLRYRSPGGFSLRGDHVVDPALLALSGSLPEAVEEARVRGSIVILTGRSELVRTKAGLGTNLKTRPTPSSTGRSCLLSQSKISSNL